MFFLWHIDDEGEEDDVSMSLHLNPAHSNSFLCGDTVEFLRYAREDFDKAGTTDNYCILVLSDLSNVFLVSNML